MSSMYAYYRFYSSSEVPLELKVHVTSLDCKHLRRTAALAGIEEPFDPEDLIARVHLYSDGVEHAEQGRFTDELPTLLGSAVFWNGWLTLPMRIRDLGRDSQLVFTVWAPGEVLLGGCRVGIFDERLRMRAGAHKLVFWPRIRRPASKEEAGDGMTAGEAAAEFLRGLHGVREAVGDSPGADEAAMDAAAEASGERTRAVLLPGVPVELSPGAAGAAMRRAEDSEEDDEEDEGSDGRGRASDASSAVSGGAPAPAPVRVRPGDTALEMMRLCRAKEEHDNGEILHLPWLDRITMKQLAQDHATAEEEAEEAAEALEAAGRGEEPRPEGVAALAARRHPLCSFLTVELPVLPFPVVYDPVVYSDVAAAPVVQEGLVGPAALEEDPVAARWMGRLVTVFDPDAGLEHPVEAKVAKLGSSDARRGVDPSAAPTPAERAAIDAVLHNPAIPSRAITGLLWRYRHTLLRNAEAVTRFIDCVDWADPEEVADATAIPWALARPEAVLRLLGPQHQHDFVRRYAIRCLEASGFDSLEPFLLQLVQAVRYEPGIVARVEQRTAARKAARAARLAGEPLTPSGSAAGAARDAWEEADAGDDAAAVTSAASGRGSEDTPVAGQAGAGGAAAPGGAASSGAPGSLGAPAASASSRSLGSAAGADPDSLSPLSDLLVRCACTNVALGSMFHWFVTVEMENDTYGMVYNTLYQCFLASIIRTADGRRRLDVIHTQSAFIGGVLSAVRATVTDSSLRADAKTTRLRESLRPGGEFGAHSVLSGPVLLALDPRVKVCGIVADGCRVFKSSVSPALIPLVVHDSTDPAFIKERFGDEAMDAFLAVRARRGSDPWDERAAVRTAGATRWTYDVLFKIGDDVRQDQLLLQLLRLMDEHFQSLSLDFCLTPYRVLATSTTTGLLEFVTGAMPLDPIKGNILGWLADRPGNRDDQGLKGVRLDVVERYTRSCAGYCVWTYILGVGDRHLDNIMITPDGRLIHIDFGYAFGKDPKPLPPKLKLTKQMVEVMGGSGARFYPDFLNRACRAFGFIRQRAGLYLDLLSLMRDAGLQSMEDDPDRAISFVADKMRLDLSDEDAELVLLAAIRDSVAAVFPLFVDFIHTFATQLR